MAASCVCTVGSPGGRPRVVWACRSAALDLRDSHSPRKSLGFFSSMAGLLCDQGGLRAEWVCSSRSCRHTLAFLRELGGRTAQTRTAALHSWSAAGAGLHLSRGADRACEALAIGTSDGWG